MKYFSIQAQEQSRLKEIDFLRGIAIILVISHHHEFIQLTARIGWIGVDLFFVLSGFLVSGLLFHEYKKYQNIKPGLFLIRRGFKIYPLFYTFLAVSIIAGLLAFRFTGKEFLVIKTNGVLGEMFFLQNYWKALWIHTWSLAVEEHFYFTLATLLYVLSRKALLSNLSVFGGICIFIFVTCFSLRLYTVLFYPEYFDPHYTHLRIDSLMFGSLIAFLYHFKRTPFETFVTNNKLKILCISLLLISTPAYIKLESFFMSTIGFSLLFIGFGGILTLALFVPKYIQVVKNTLTLKIFNLISKIGFYSYSIYLFHMFTKRYFIGALKQYVPLNMYVSFFLYAILSIAIGYVAARIVEYPFLNMRETYFPKRSK